MIKKQIIKENNKPVAIVLDYKEYLKLREIEEDFLDYNSAVETKATNKGWTDPEKLKEELGIK